MITPISGAVGDYLDFVLTYFFFIGFEDEERRYREEKYICQS